MIIKDNVTYAADRATLFNLKRDSNFCVRQIAESIDDIRQNKDWTNEEKRELDLIENLRNELENCTESIEVTDYGAGNPTSEKQSKRWILVATQQELSEIFVKLLQVLPNGVN